LGLEPKELRDLLRMLLISVVVHPIAKDGTGSIEFKFYERPVNTAARADLTLQAGVYQPGPEALKCTEWLPG